MKRLSFFLPLLISLSASPVMALGQMKQIALVAEEAIYAYFQPSGRRVSRVVLGKLVKINTRNNEYLVEADAVAQSAISGNLIQYSCGVFIKKYRNGWEELHTECEPLTSDSF